MIMFSMHGVMLRMLTRLRPVAEVVCARVYHNDLAAQIFTFSHIVAAVLQNNEC